MTGDPMYDFTTTDPNDRPVSSRPPAPALGKDPEVWIDIGALVTVIVVGVACLIGVMLLWIS